MASGKNGTAREQALGVESLPASLSFEESLRELEAVAERL